MDGGGIPLASDAIKLRLNSGYKCLGAANLCISIHKSYLIIVCSVITYSILFVHMYKQYNFLFNIRKDILYIL